jgi:hypothetical protein
MVEKLVDQSITEDELLEIGLQLEKNKSDGYNALKLLKLLEKKDVTAMLLKKTMIGKKLTAVVEEFADDAKLTEDLKFYKQTIKKKWLTVYK